MISRFFLVILGGAAVAVGLGGRPHVSGTTEMATTTKFTTCVSKQTISEGKAFAWPASISELKDEQKSLMDQTLRARLLTLLAQLSPTTLNAVVQAYDEAGWFDGDHYHEQYLLLDAWAAFDTFGALDFALHEVGTDCAHGVVTSLLLELDAQDAIRYLQRQPEHQQIAAAQNWATYCANASNQVAETNAASARLDSYGAIVRIWSEADPQAAQNWYQSLSN